ncbi:Ger(x)C family spore germination protein [Chengkuizengella axinellae]|uniref:Ger(X)C family spore germination protein n=1 Tax=Chengkuizengella axinellae TaxID=3064388 RepID=A0ABT9J5N6_9BACL|nr:Ger(x)C family spore germination protein [Chengkuizengella sp. 2205SS18-9]MDP5276767.1 Ger(x)C family spore germination protein [Chengkuizengella sp. 2205SS18-9]
MKKALCLLFILLLSGCMNNYGIDDLAMLSGIAFDTSEEDYLDVTAMYQVPTETDVFEYLHATSKNTEIELMSQTKREIAFGQLRIALFGEEIASEGIYPIILSFLRDPSIGPLVKLAVTKGTAKDILITKLEKEPNTGSYIETMLAKFDEEYVFPSVNLLRFTRSYFDDGVDPFLPLISSTGKNIILDGLVLFQNDRLVTTLNKEKSIYMLLLAEDFKKGVVDLVIEFDDKKEDIHLSYVRNSHKTKVMREDNQFSIHYDIEMSGSLEGYSGDQTLKEDTVQKEIEIKINNALNREMKEMLLFLQKHKVDPIGVGGSIRNSLSYAEWKKLNWEETYPNINFSIDVSMKIRNVSKFN